MSRNGSSSHNLITISIYVTEFPGLLSVDIMKRLMAVTVKHRTGGITIRVGPMINIRNYTYLNEHYAF